MIKFLASILFLVFAFQLVYPAAFTAWFFANQKAIAEKYCINKARPMLHCDGKCFLARKLRAAEEKRNSAENAPMRDVWVEIQPCILQETKPEVFPCLSDPSEYARYRPVHFNRGHIRSLFRPPAPHAA